MFIPCGRLSWLPVSFLLHVTHCRIVSYRKFRKVNKGGLNFGVNKFRSSATNAKRSFNRSRNAIFGNVGRIVSEEVTLQLVKSKCLPILLYGLECYSLLKADLYSRDFVVMRFLMKLFRTANKGIIDECR